PALVSTLNQEKVSDDNKKLKETQKVAIAILCFLATIVLFSIIKYWRADTLYAKAKLLNAQGNYPEATKALTQAIKISSKEPLFYNELAESTLGIAMGMDLEKDKEKVQEIINLALTQSQTATTLSSANVNLLRSRAGIFFKLATIEPNYLLFAGQTLEEAIKLAPTDAKLFYNLGLVYARVAKEDQALSTIQKTIELKPNYRDARLAYALLLDSKGEKQEARDQLNYILENINPNDNLVKQQLEEIN
ncbi:tetratricopeptide repeat protein, partial [Patescibacteria group bacterium]